MFDISEEFGSMVFSDHVMRQLLPKTVYESLKKTREEGRSLDEAVADVVAAAMKDWAMSKGATHYTHWFQPMTGITAEKHDAFLSRDSQGHMISEFSGKALVKGEPDASSFPSGGLRATFEARGYTAWDPTSYAFIKDGTLCIPTAFCSYTGQVLDKKTPLLRSMDALSAAAVRVLALFGKKVRRVNATVGPEQEYFLIDRADYDKRLDLRVSGRTLIGAPAAKGQELDDHYFGSIRPRVKAFMEDLDKELWRLGVPSKTEHNEVAPCQHEMAPIFDNVNVATDANQLTMELMRKVAERHGLACLLHEKPFKGVNGSGKHNNWSISTDSGENLLDPGRTPAGNAQFLLFLTAVIRAVDEYQDLLRISVASAGNDHRLGANEAPPAIVSIFVGDELESVISSLTGSAGSGKEKKSGVIDIGAAVLPKLARDNSDRNRTSPFAFTGDKFEFRMPGSSFNIACTNIMLNTAVADSLEDFADELEPAAGDKEAFLKSLNALVTRELKAHERIIFNGNGYSKEWEEEAARRGLSNYKKTPDALEHYTDEKNVSLFERHHVYTREELVSRAEICLDEYQKAVRIEASAMLEMLHRQVIPAASAFSKDLAQSIQAKSALGLESKGERTLCRRVTGLLDSLVESVDALDVIASRKVDGVMDGARYASDVILAQMDVCRDASDSLEALVGKEYWPVPTYSDILFR